MYPGTNDILKKINKILGYDFTPHLASLWSDDKNEAEKYVEIYTSACSLLLEQTYYARIGKFCKEKNIQLTGHPSKGDDLGLLQYFDIPGQDLVWRWILPDTPSALEGEESTQAKCSSSAMIHGKKRRNLNECCGAYGHELTWDEMMWLGNWCIIRGVNLLVPHAFYYSIRSCRKDERPPDVGPNAKWWSNYSEYSDAFKRLCWINNDSTHVCNIAILGKANKLPWKSAKICFENQIDFNYIEETQLLESAQISKDGIQIADMNYQGLIVELDEDSTLNNICKDLQSNNQIYRYTRDSDNPDLIKFIQEKSPNHISFSPQRNNLRIRHVIKNGIHYHLLFNETKAETEAICNGLKNETTSVFNLVTGKSEPINMNDPLRFKPYEMKVLLTS
ncbi:MAG: hypothetical protein COA79_04245 [Planctomycetota bacterium]|nr:MAG: hypothetical protein COA79_04245 [Planctomycetota bacterium]